MNCREVDAMRVKSKKWLLGLFLVFTMQPAIAADSELKIVRVEEDWELVVETPDPLQDAPQISTWMSPTGTLEGQYFGLDLNHAQRDGYDGGGFQTKAMNGSTVAEDRLSFIGDNLNVQGENIRWTQLIAIVDDDLVFAIKNGTSQSWGSFGGPETLLRQSSNIANLNSYTPELSLQSSGVGYASNRVASLKLLRVRLYSDQGQITEINLDRSIQ
jgi:hypothetical protein